MHLNARRWLVFGVVWVTGVATAGAAAGLLESKMTGPLGAVVEVLGATLSAAGVFYLSERIGLVPASVPWFPSLAKWLGTQSRRGP